MLLAFQASAFDRSATCPDSAASPRTRRNSRGANHINSQFFLAGSAGGGAIGLDAEYGGGASRQGSLGPRTRSGVLSCGTLSALRVFGVSSPGGACRGGTSCAPA